MIATCKDRERICGDGTAAEWTALEAHAVSCAACAEELRAWRSLSVVAKELQDYSPSPELWTRIERALREEETRKAQRVERKSWFSLLPDISVGWRTALAGAFGLILAVSVSWMMVQDRHVQSGKQGPLLKSAALREVERTESAYEKAIDKLAREAKLQLDAPATPLLANYHEKLLVLDSAIDDLRAQAGLNPSNAQLRYQLLAMYQEKQRTLEEVLEGKK
jgi:anti-sigma-K factor RskA